MDQKRVFIAIDISAEARRAVASHVDGLRRLHPGTPSVRWVDPKNLHVTLRFVGNIDAGEVSEWEARVGRVAKKLKRI